MLWLIDATDDVQSPIGHATSMKVFTVGRATGHVEADADAEPIQSSIRHGAQLGLCIVFTSSVPSVVNIEKKLTRNWERIERELTIWNPWRDGTAQRALSAQPSAPSDNGCRCRTHRSWWNKALHALIYWLSRSYSCHFTQIFWRVFFFWVSGIRAKFSLILIGGDYHCVVIGIDWIGLDWIGLDWMISRDWDLVDLEKKLIMDRWWIELLASDLIDCYR